MVMFYDKDRTNLPFKNKNEKGKPVERRGRKATSLKHFAAMIVGLPNDTG